MPGSLAKPIFIRLAGFVAALLLAGCVHSQETPRDPKQNAALQYWLAFAQLPNADPWKAGEVCTEEVGERLTQATREYVSGAELRLFRCGAKMPYCEWGLNRADGLEMTMPYLPKARHLAHVAVYRFQMWAEDGRAKEGIEDLVACMALSRHVGSDTVLIPFMVHIKMDNMAIERLSFFLPQLDKASLKLLATALDRLPSVPTSANAMRLEKQVYGTWIKNRLTAELDGNLLKAVEKLMGTGEQEPDRITPEEVLANVAEMERFYDRMTQMLELPYDEFKKELPNHEARLKRASALTQRVAPALSGIRRQEVEMHVRSAMFRAAIDVLLEGPDALKRHPDPYGGQPFAHRVTEHGFELASKLENKSGPLKLKVGGEGGPRAHKGDAPPKPPEF